MALACGHRENSLNWNQFNELYLSEVCNAFLCTGGKSACLQTDLLTIFLSIGFLLPACIFHTLSVRQRFIVLFDLPPWPSYHIGLSHFSEKPPVLMSVPPGSNFLLTVCSNKKLLSQGLNCLFDVNTIIKSKFSQFILTPLVWNVNTIIRTRYCMGNTNFNQQRPIVSEIATVSRLIMLPHFWYSNTINGTRIQRGNQNFSSIE